MKWAKVAKQQDYSSDPLFITCKSQTNQLEKWLKLKGYHSSQKMVKLDKSKMEVLVECFDFKTMLFSLLNDPYLTGDLNNLDVNKINPFSKYQSPGNSLSCVNSGQWYHHAWKHLCHAEDNFLIPIIMACDETQVSNFGKTSAWPIIFTTSIFSQSLCNTPEAWPPLGYIYDLSMKQSLSQHAHTHNDVKYTHLHQIIKQILKHSLLLRKWIF